MAAIAKHSSPLVQLAAWRSLCKRGMTDEIRRFLTSVSPSQLGDCLGPAIMHLSSATDSTSTPIDFVLKAFSSIDVSLTAKQQALIGVGMCAANVGRSRYSADWFRTNSPRLLACLREASSAPSCRTAAAAGIILFGAGRFGYKGRHDRAVDWINAEVTSSFTPPLEDSELVDACCCLLSSFSIFWPQTMWLAALCSGQLLRRRGPSAWDAVLALLFTQLRFAARNKWERPPPGVFLGSPRYRVDDVLTLAAAAVIPSPVRHSDLINDEFFSLLLEVTKHAGAYMTRTSALLLLSTLQPMLTTGVVDSISSLLHSPEGEESTLR